MCVHKTGTSSIQKTTETFEDELREDGYEMPWVVSMNHWGGERSQMMKLFGNQVHFASCFLPQHVHNAGGFPCVSDLLLLGLEIANQGENLLVSAETFDRIDPEGLDAFSAYLSPRDDVVIIIYYRRYYDWEVSFYNQWVNDRKLADTTNKWTTSIVDSVFKTQSHT